MSHYFSSNYKSVMSNKKIIIFHFIPPSLPSTYQGSLLHDKKTNPPTHHEPCEWVYIQSIIIQLAIFKQAEHEYYVLSNRMTRKMQLVTMTDDNVAEITFNGNIYIIKILRIIVQKND